MTIPCKPDAPNELEKGPDDFDFAAYAKETIMNLPEEKAVEIRSRWVNPPEPPAP